MEHELAAAILPNAQDGHLYMLDSIGQLIMQLQACSHFATSTWAARIRLHDGSLSEVGFSTRLASTSNDGLDALAQLHGFLFSMGIACRDMAKEGGILEKLQSTYGMPEERKTHERYLKKLTNSLKKCNENTEEVQNKLKSWQLMVQEFWRIIQETQGEFSRRMGKNETKIGNLKTHAQYEEVALRRAMEQEAEAKRQHGDILNHKANVEKNLQFPTSFNAAAGNWEMLLTSALRLAPSLVANWWYAGDLEKARDDVESHRSRAMQFKEQIEESQIQIQHLTTKTIDLENFCKALEPTLQALVGIVDKLRVLSMNVNMSLQMVGKMTEGAIESQEMSQESKHELVTLSDIRDYGDNTRQIREYTLIVQHLAFMYCKIIQNTMLLGSGQLSELGNARSEDPSRVFREAIKMGQQASARSSTSSLILAKMEDEYRRSRRVMLITHDAEIDKLDELEKKQKKEAEKKQRVARPSLWKKVIRRSSDR
ncbi:hypothetical protein HD806DRAFT_488918 [Xylariaceae sp. AK1471]|nr:hypothetical protein HD806DRAFT_488918 [Xylariaceae sp. AK1471]